MIVRGFMVTLIQWLPIPPSDSQKVFGLPSVRWSEVSSSCIIYRIIANEAYIAHTDKQEIGNKNKLSLTFYVTVL